MPELLKKIHNHHEGLSPSKVARKYEYLKENAFRFFRGTNKLFYEDLLKMQLPSSPVSWICGDLHLENFGSYKGDNKLVYFDINDFDESVLAPISWELVRMITSILVAFDELKITNEETLSVIEIFLKKYTETLSGGKPKYIERRVAKGIIKKFLNRAERLTSEQALKKHTILKNGKAQFASS